MMNTTDRWTKKDVQTFLARGNWFGALPGRLQDGILAGSEVKRLSPNSTLYEIGDEVDGLYAALAGDIRAYAYGEGGQRIFLRVFGPGTWFGNVHILDDDNKRTFQVCSISASTVLFLSVGAFREMTSDPACYKAFVQLMCNHMRHTVRVQVEARSEAPIRAARALLRLARAHGVAGDKGTRLAMTLSQADLASLVGVSRQYMNELIVRWEHEGLLRWNGKAQPIIHAERLRGLLSPLDHWIEDAEDWI